MIKFLDLHKINQRFETAFQTQLHTFFSKGRYILGEQVQHFEQQFAVFNQDQFCIGVGNGLDALSLIFKGYIALGKLQKGDEVLVPAHTYIASILALTEIGLVPVLVEPNEETFLLDASLLQDKITSKTKAILVVHLYGRLANIAEIESLAHQHNLLIVEDCAQSHGINETSSHSKAFSFYPGKNLGCLGDGGAITTNDEVLAELLFKLRNYGSAVKYVHEIQGVNSRLDEIQALFLSIKLPFLQQDNLRRQAIAQRYTNEIKNPLIQLPQWDIQTPHVFHLFVIRTPHREALQSYFKTQGIETLIHYPIPPHKQKAYEAWNDLSFPITEKLHQEVLSLPISPVMTEDEVTYVIQKTSAWTL